MKRIVKTLDVYHGEMFIIAGNRRIKLFDVNDTQEMVHRSTMVQGQRYMLLGTIRTHTFLLRNSRVTERFLSTHKRETMM